MHMLWHHHQDDSVCHHNDGQKAGTALFDICVIAATACLHNVHTFDVAASSQREGHGRVQGEAKRALASCCLFGLVGL